MGGFHPMALERISKVAPAASRVLEAKTTRLKLQKLPELTVFGASASPRIRLDHTFRVVDRRPEYRLMNQGQRVSPQRREVVVFRAQEI